ncbi:MAG TPA: choice-of-anchor Q domain-containing protein [Rudaea sp.]|nr:choice-of-anchor Q domain-containing protein [Rudaea sp.]
MNPRPTAERRRPLAVAIATCFALVGFSPACFAAYDNVTNCNDAGAGSLRDTIANAASGDTVILNPVAMQCSVITLTSGEIVVARQDLTVKYNGNNSNRFTLSGNLGSRVFKHTGTGTLKLQRLGIELGKYTNPPGGSAKGGCIYSAGTVDLEYSSVTACKLTGNADHTYARLGGGIYAGMHLIVNHSTISANSVTDPTINYQANGGGAAAPAITATYSTFSGNSAGGYGGGMYATDATGEGSGSLIRQCTISGNTGHRGAGISTRGNSLTILESTISGNSAGSYGSGMFVDGTPTAIYNSTIAFNRGVNTCGVFFNERGNYSYALQSSIVANNTYSTGSSIRECDVTGDITSGSHNIVLTSFGNLPSDTDSRDPLLFALADNGGATFTHALRNGSPAFGAGENLTRLATDQRGTGFARVVDGAVDIGAYEVQDRDDLIFANGFD